MFLSKRDQVIDDKNYFSCPRETTHSIHHLIYM